MYKWFLVLAVFLLISAGCGADRPLSGTVAPQRSPAPTGAAAKQNWEQRWEQTLDAARTEGVVTMYTSGAPSVREEMARDFGNRFGIRLEFVTGISADLTVKVAAERRAGLFLADVFQSGHDSLITTLHGDGFLQPFDPVLMLPEVVDGKMWSLGQIPYMNKDRTVIGFLANHFSHIVLNTDLVKEGQIKSYNDILKPEWKGRIVMDNPVLPGPGRNWLKLIGAIHGYDPDKLRAYLTQLARQEPVIIKDPRLAMEWVSKGKHAMLLGVSTGMYSNFKAMGAPISYSRMVEGSLMTSSPGGIALMKQPAHPNAAIILVNWLLTKEGQSSYTRTLGSPSARLDVPASGIDPAFLRIPGETVHVENEEMLAATEKMVEVARQTLATQLK